MKVGDCAGIIAQRYFHPGDWSLYLLTKVSAGLLFSSFSTLIQVVRFGKKKKKNTSKFRFSKTLSRVYHVLESLAESAEGKLLPQHVRSVQWFVRLFHKLVFTSKIQLHHKYKCNMIKTNKTIPNDIFCVLQVSYSTSAFLECISYKPLNVLLTSYPAVLNQHFLFVITKCFST